MSIFKLKTVNDLTTRIQRQRLRTLKYSLTVYHVPGKHNNIADLVSRQPLSKPDAEDKRLSREIESAAISTVSSLPASEHRLHDLRLQQAEDTTLRQVITSSTMDGQINSQTLRLTSNHTGKVTLN